MDELKEYLQGEQERWLRILNEEYRTDTGNSVEEYARGRLTAYAETLKFISIIEEEDGRSTKEEKRVRSQVQ
jgi:hypothetical protein